MTDKPNCSTCNHIQTESTGIPDDICNKDLKNPVRMTEDRKWIIKRYGCFSHPQAREYLMREVIAELERLHDEIDIKLPYGALLTPMEIREDERCYAYKQAIALIREVK